MTQMETQSQKENKVNLLTTEEVCEMLKCSKVTLWRYRKSGKIKAYGLGSKVLFKEHEVLAALTPLNTTCY